MNPNVKYRNLAAEMTRRGITNCDVSRVLELKTERTVRDKLSGKYPFTFNEVKTIRDTFFMGMDLEYLFAETE